MDEYKKIVVEMSLWDLDEVAKFLIAAREHGMHIVYTFNSVKGPIPLNSDDIFTVDDAYKIVTGVSKAEFEAKRQEVMKEILAENPMEENQDKGNSISM